MKTKKLVSSVIFLALALVFSANAQVGNDAVVNTKKEVVSAFLSKDGYIKLAINNPNGVKYNVRVLDNRKAVWYQEKTNDSLYRRTLDVSELPVNQYTIIVTGGSEVYTYEISKSEEIKLDLKLQS